LKSVQDTRRTPVARLLHLQTHTPIVLPQKELIHLGKPNKQIPIDIDLSAFPHSDIVSRIHADIWREEDVFFVEDMGSANGTYLNHTLLVPGHRYKLNANDKIALGKAELVTFIFGLF
jgi:pSer/pThr/pTyr-binding forkhead associated (FHA) protein